MQEEHVNLKQIIHILNVILNWQFNNILSKKLEEENDDLLIQSIIF